MFLYNGERVNAKCFLYCQDGNNNHLMGGAGPVSLLSKLTLCCASVCARVNSCTFSGTSLICWFQVFADGRCRCAAACQARSKNMQQHPQSLCCTYKSQHHAVGRGTQCNHCIRIVFKCQWRASNWPVLLQVTGPKLSSVIKKQKRTYKVTWELRGSCYRYYASISILDF